VDFKVEGDTAFYFHSGNWEDAGLPQKYAELEQKPKVEFGNASSFLLSLSLPAGVLNWDPALPIEVSVRGNRTPARTSCRVRSADTGQVIFEDAVPGGGLSVLGLPNGRIRVDCIASDAFGSSGYESAETRVYDVLLLLEACGAAFALVLGASAVFLYRVRRGLRKVPKGPECPRCAMPLAEGARSCPVCGKKLAR
jgi:hypothetical protein